MCCSFVGVVYQRRLLCYRRHLSGCGARCWMQQAARRREAGCKTAPDVDEALRLALWDHHASRCTFPPVHSTCSESKCSTFGTIAALFVAGKSAATRRNRQSWRTCGLKFSTSSACHHFLQRFSRFSRLSSAAKAAKCPKLLCCVSGKRPSLPTLQAPHAVATMVSAAVRDQVSRISYQSGCQAAFGVFQKRKRPTPFSVLDVWSQVREVTHYCMFTQLSQRSVRATTLRREDYNRIHS